jgi:hypothetical protein
MKTYRIYNMFRAFVAIGACSLFAWITIESADALNYAGVVFGVISFFLFFSFAMYYLSKAQPRRR